MLPRSASEESLLTLYSGTTPSEHDSASVFSEETLSTASLSVFGRRLVTYTRIREFPVVVGVIKLDIQLFRSLKSLKSEEPAMFTIQLNKFHFLKKNAPLLSTYLHDSEGKSEFCKVYFKILLNNLTCYVLMFQSGENVVVFNDALKPHHDAIYKGTKIRLYGASAASTFGNGLIKMFLLHGSSPLLADGVDTEKLAAATNIREVDLSGIVDSAFYTAVSKQHRTTVLKLLSQAAPMVSIPYATYLDNGDRKMDGVRVSGSMRLFESTEESLDGEIGPPSYVVATIMLVLVEQELRKMRGTSKPLYVRGYESSD